jgi:hypothetical protein
MISFVHISYRFILKYIQSILELLPAVAKMCRTEVHLGTIFGENIED